MSDLLADHYGTLVEERGYDAPDFALGDLPASAVRETFACSERGAEFASRFDGGARSLVTTGISMTGPPHVGTLGQILTARRLQRAGFDVQVVVADLAAYNAAGRDLEAVRTLAERYVEFVRAMGFDADAGILRTQEDARDVLHTQFLLSRYFDPDAGSGTEDSDGEAEASPSPTGFESELAAAYEAAESRGAETPAFADRQTTLSLVSDTLHPILKEGYDNVCFVGGADNCGLARLCDRVLRKSPYDGSIAGLYTKLVAGREGFPKMSKSIPDSRLSLDATPESLRECVRRSEGGDDPDADRTFQMMQVASAYSPEELAERREACARGDSTWEDAKREYANYLVEAAERWKQTE